MAPLDTGHVMNLRLVDPLRERAGPSPNDFDTIGAYLRAVREHKGLTLGDLAESTRIGSVYLQGIEESDLSVLPSRPFTSGFVRSYATALGIDGDAAAARFKHETPDFAEPLRNPVGVSHEKTGRNPLIFGLVGVVVLGVVVWNVTQHSVARDARSTPSSSLSAPPPETSTVRSGPIALGAATPPPADQTMPAPYLTPGMDPVGSAEPGQTTQVVKTPVIAQPAAPTGYAPPSTFTPRGQIYGASTDAHGVILQAIKPATLIVRGPGGAVYFARQLAAGEAYRASLGAGLTADIADPAAFNVYAYGLLQPTLTAGPMPVDKMAVRTPPPPPAPAQPAAVAAPAPGAPAPVQSPPAPAPASSGEPH